jgi:hypothetical protein
MQVNEKKLCFQVIKLSSHILVALRQNSFLCVIPLMLMLNRTWILAHKYANSHTHKKEVYIVLIDFINTDRSSDSLLSKNMFAGTLMLAFSFKVEAGNAPACI